MSMDGLNTGFAGAETSKPLSRKKCIFRDALVMMGEELVRVLRGQEEIFSRLMRAR